MEIAKYKSKAKHETIAANQSQNTPKSVILSSFIVVVTWKNVESASVATALAKKARQGRLFPTKQTKPI